MIASESRRPTSLSMYHGRRISVLLSMQSGFNALCGSAAYGVDPLLGNVLKVVVDAPDLWQSPSELLIRESDWSGLIFPDLRQDSDYCFLLTPR